MSKELEDSRNGFLRQRTSSTVQKITGKLHQRFPEVTPNHLTIAGLIGVSLAGAYAAYEQNSKGEKYYSSPFSILLPLSVMFGSMLCDALDGSLARTIQKENPLAHNSSSGQQVDGLADRMSELMLGIIRMVAAHNRNDPLGEIIAFTATLTNAFPSLLRGFAEEQGHIVPETGKGLTGLLGTRIGRSTANLFATILPNPLGIPVQEIMDGITTIANTKTAFDRLKIALIPQETTLSPKEIDDAKARTRLYLATTGAVFATSLATYRFLHNQTPQKELS